MPLLLSIALLPAVALAQPSDEAKKEAKKAQEMARKSINSTGAQIDACSERYLVENPGQKGQAKVSVRIVKGGRVDRAEVTTSLPQARTLRLCLERIAKTWRLPAPKSDKPDELSIQVPVVKGYKFKIYGPDEEPPPPPPGQPKAQGFIKFTPKFLRNWGEDKK